jgi:hypothetical protein
MDNRELLRSIQEGYDQLKRLLERLSPEQADVPGAVGGWSVKDTLAHLLAHEERMLRWVDDRLAGRIPPEPQPYDLPEELLTAINRRIFDENHDRPLDEILADLDEFHALAIEMVRGTAEGDLNDPSRHQLEGGEALCVAVAANTYEHFQEHEGELLAWLAKQDGQGK